MIFGRGYGRPGDELQWSWLNNLLKMCRTNQIILGPNCGLQMVKSEGVGTALMAISPASNLPFLAVTSTAITANVVVTAGVKWTQGGGSVFEVNRNGTNLEADTSIEFDVINWSTTTGGIPINTLVWVDTDGSTDSSGNPNWFITAVDCGN